MAHDTFVKMCDDGLHGVFVIGQAGFIYRRNVYHASGAFRVVEQDGRRGIEVSPFTAWSPAGADKEETEKIRHKWMARNWLSARRAFRKEGFEFWIFERLDEETGLMTWHKEMLTSVSNPANQAPRPEGQKRSGVFEMSEKNETVTLDEAVEVSVSEPRDIENDDRLELHAVRYFAGKKRPGFWLTAGWDGSERAIDGIQAILGVNVGEAFKQMQLAKDSQ